MKLSTIYKNLRNDLRVIEKRLEETVRSSHGPLNRSSVHLLEAGGKRMRPVFVLLSGKFGNDHIDQLQSIAVSLELIHMATLVHDDVIDDAATRRGRETVKAKWDNRVAMYTGDFIFARSLSLAATLPNPSVHHVLSNAIIQMCQGEIEQLRDFYNYDQSFLNYFRRIKRKTALLMAVSCQLGGMVSEACPQVVRLLYLYGYYVGMAFQITDDVLDIVGDERELGKPAGSDLRQGNVTLPVIYVLKKGSNSDRRAVIAYLKQRDEHQPLGDLLGRLRASGGIFWSEKVAAQYLSKAHQVLNQLPPGEARTSFQLIADFVGERSY